MLLYLTSKSLLRHREAVGRHEKVGNLDPKNNCNLNNFLPEQAVVYNPIWVPGKK